MPIYGYHCDQCGHEVEVLQSMSDPPLKVCSNCMGPLRKMIYPAGIIYKGTGYYSTDYKTASAPSRGSSDSGGESGGEPGDGGKSGPPKADGQEGPKAGPDPAKSEGTSESKREAAPRSDGSGAAKSGSSESRSGSGGSQAGSGGGSASSQSKKDGRPGGKEVS